MKRICIEIICFTLLLAACKDDKEDYGAGLREAFEQQTEYGVYRQSLPCFVYNKTNHQISETEYSYRIQTDSQDSCLMCCWSANQAEQFTLSVHSASLGKLLPSGDYQVVLLKRNNRKSWLWDAQQETGFIIEMQN